MRYAIAFSRGTISVFKPEGANLLHKMIVRFLLFTLLAGQSLALSAQNTIKWEALLDVRYSTTFDGEAGYVYMKPIYGESLLALNGKEIEIKGYVLPMDTDGKAYALSAFPYSACFFCGGGGKESIMDLRLASTSRRYKTDEVVTFKGVFRLNDDQFGLNYVIEEAEPVE